MFWAVWVGPQQPRFSVSLPDPALSLPSQDTYSDSALPCFLLPTRDIWFPASLPGKCKTSSSWDISCFPPSSLLKIAIGVNTGRHVELQPPLTDHQAGPVSAGAWGFRAERERQLATVAWSSCLPQRPSSVHSCQEGELTYLPPHCPPETDPRSLAEFKGYVETD